VSNNFCIVPFDFILEVVFGDALPMAGNFESHSDLQTGQQKSVTPTTDGFEED
jgi:hypothetical protein